MALLTTVATEDAQRIADAYGLGPLKGLIPVPAGTVNTNHFIDTASGRHFLRIYEQQQVAGVEYEWRLLAHLKAGGLPVAAPLPGVAPGVLRVAGKPVAVFDRLQGESLCQARVSAAFLRVLGGTLARAHLACQDFQVRHASRFGLEQVSGLLQQAAEAGREELGAPLARLAQLAQVLSSREFGGLPVGVIHGDLFRDNVLWSSAGELSGLLDWESASDGLLVYDVAVTLLAWCCGDELDWDQAAALLHGYQAVRPLQDAEWDALPDLLRLGCLRFATTRIVDVYLPGNPDPRYKHYRRFLERLDRVEAFDVQAFRQRVQ